MDVTNTTKILLVYFHKSSTNTQMLQSDVTHTWVHTVSIGTYIHAWVHTVRIGTYIHGYIQYV